MRPANFAKLALKTLDAQGISPATVTIRLAQDEVVIAIV